ncbi:pyruvate dehydrogenase (acetyl-transferring) E1 component subunit alpha [Microbacterium sp. zg.Y1090]|uniref:pyruvate dehydrogenase (acetyl-transferring) E1 component subunit alpha n=1 Tax=Microbacterium TaxID=33882 RepID=UPI00214C3C2B|nr:MULTISPECIES: pyruvate dehydrogenase (acetyl-transferring) E1 component subunit alpha [unclassified Microbacterium]MCR2811983.1 pyruvate dehydrogenase (acetyl-transferring) E1 component subunit alpha [Microbacterium sp. zg.Y1084]MCR2818578.1 pyruvate dehydrogenase (acetyl-transferring) E1 component subunit alpha [Microbacterium sp. zg.Y1090]MDL5486391.1 pyruvate dehydrogenase (acetyl-transferring) E1 component subunit alpha [Microbacterium sp. zg-Y1211]WIM29581.1 pyruvate dehydrogenase (acet
MTYPPSTAMGPTTDMGQVSRLITAEGERVSDPALEGWVADVDNALLADLYRDMVRTRRLDAEGVALQRQGQLGLWAPCQGQEAVQVGTARALRESDFVFPSYRESGVQLVRGATPTQLIQVWRGEEQSMGDPFARGTAGPQIIIGAQTLHAVGYAMGIQRTPAAEGARCDEVAVTYFGDGASSQGDVSEAMVFAASYGAPVVFVCSNNQWAISEPVTVQSRTPLADRAPAFGIPSMRVDGNDVLACYGAMRWALERARSGAGPAYIEAVTYRMGPHTTADDPTRYRDAAEVEVWRARDPLARVQTLLQARGALGDALAADIAADADRLAAEVRAVCLGYRTRDPLSVFDEVYAEPHSGLERQRRAYAAYLDGFEEEAR